MSSACYNILMKITSTYKVKIKHYNNIFKDTVALYRNAVDYFINVCLNEWNDLSVLDGHNKLTYIEKITHTTVKNGSPKYGFDNLFYKFPSYLRRGAINEAIGKVSSHKSSLSNWEEADPRTRGAMPSIPKAGYIYPCMYKTDMYNQTDMYTDKVKVFVRNTWDWIDITLKKSDVDYINRWCTHRKKCAPTL